MDSLPTLVDDFYPIETPRLTLSTQCQPVPPTGYLQIYRFHEDMPLREIETQKNTYVRTNWVVSNLRWPKFLNKTSLQMLKCSKGHEKMILREHFELQAFQSTPLEAIKYAYLTWAGRSVKSKLTETHIFSRAGWSGISDCQNVTTK